MRLKIAEEARKISSFLLERWRKGDLVPVRVVTHIDADGLSSGAVLSLALRRLGVPHHVTFVKYLSLTLLEELSNDDYPLNIFSDLGSGYIEDIKSTFKNRTVLILDHHMPNGRPGDGVLHLNPFDFGLNGDLDLSGAGVCYLLAREMCNGVPPHIPLVGALGDMQINRSGDLVGMNSSILNEAVSSGLVEVRRDIRLFGGPEYPLAAALERTVDPTIPGITGNSLAAVKLLEDLDIPVKKGDKWTTLEDLSEDKKKVLLNKLIERISSAGGDPKALLGRIYLLRREKRGSPLRDLRSFATVLNACGRVGAPYIGLFVAQGMRGEFVNRAFDLLSEYRRALMRYLGRFEKGELISRRGSILLVEGEGFVKDTIIGTLVSILSRNTRGVAFVIGYAETDHEMMKISIRKAASISSGVNLNDVAKKLGEAYGGRGGGHADAAGALIPAQKLKEFLEELIRSLETQTRI